MKMPEIIEKINMEKIKTLVFDLISRFNKLEKRRRNLVLLLIATVLFSLLFNVIYKPQRTTLRKLKRQLLSLKDRAAEIQARIPDTQAEKRALTQAQRSQEALRAQIASMEAKLPLAESLPYLLGDLISRAQGFTIDFTSIKPVTTKKQQEYARLNIEMKFNANYSDLVNYLRRLENTSKFLTTTDITMEEMEEGFNANAEMSIILSCLLGEGPKDKMKIAEKEEQAAIEPIALERDPLTSKFMPQREKKKEKEYKLSGIISRGEKSSAIINDQVYRVGDVIGKEKVKQILPNMVVLTDGKKSIVLTLEKE